jgi:hypothetical protein
MPKTYKKKHRRREHIANDDNDGAVSANDADPLMPITVRCPFWLLALESV